MMAWFPDALMEIDGGIYFDVTCVVPSLNQGIGKDVPRAQRTSMGNPYISPINTMGTLLGVHPIVPWLKEWAVTSWPWLFAV